MSCRDAKIGDTVIANRLANEHHRFTKEGWIGIIQKIDAWGTAIAEGEYPDGSNKGRFSINLDCFDFYLLTTAQELARQLGFEGKKESEVRYDYN